MDSKQFSELLVSKRVEAGVSIDEMSKRMQVTPYVVQDIERGVYNSNMAQSMNYLMALRSYLVLIDRQQCKFQLFGTYEELAKWCALKWPCYYHFNEGRQDACGVHHFSVSGRGVDQGGIIRQKLLELCQSSALDINVMNAQQLSDFKIEVVDELKKNNKPSNIESVCNLISILITVIIVIGWCVLIYKIGNWISLCGHEASSYFMSLLLLTIGIGFIFVLLPIGVIPVSILSFMYFTFALQYLFEKASKFTKR